MMNKLKQLLLAKKKRLEDAANARLKEIDETLKPIEEIIVIDDIVESDDIMEELTPAKPKAKKKKKWFFTK